MTADELDDIEKQGRLRLESAATADDLRAAEAEVVGKRSPLAARNAALGALSPDERRTQGRLVNEVRRRLSELSAARAVELQARERAARLDAERLDLTEVLPGPRRGHLNLVTQTRDELEDVFVGMGYTVSEGPEAETDWHSFEALNFPKGHPARSGFDTLYLDWGEPESTLLRPHTSPVQIRVMQSQPPPIYSIMPGKVYRKDTPDARHTASFNQVEGLVVDKGVTFGDLAGTIEAFTGAYFGPGIHSRLRPAYFPFTEPSAEFEITCAICSGAGCRTCSGTGWIELGGCGMVHPNVLAAVGLDAEEWSGFAFGFGIDRCAQMRHGISDMRILLDNDIRFISQF
ncbi:MAG TPA: phenylalanine--tRNA ligase subunit alpha [Acidimicrobiales bacterium]|nr:phenylalanine--tRNA ligase subunit alpha [Acidimicrobiales bacterium]